MATVLLLAGGLAFGLVGWRVLTLQQAERERQGSRRLDLALARARSDALRLAAAPRGRPLASWRLEPEASVRRASPEVEPHMRALLRAAGLESNPTEALQHYDALLEPSLPTWVRDVASLRSGILLNGMRRFGESRRRLARAAEASPLLLGVENERVALMALRYLALDAQSRGDATELRKLLDTAEDGGRLAVQGIVGPARIVVALCDDLEATKWWRVEPADRARLLKARQHAQRGLSLLQVLPESGVAVSGREIAWRGSSRLALFPLESLAEPPGHGVQPLCELAFASPGEKLPPGALRLEAPLAAVIVRPLPQPKDDDVALWIAVALGLGLLAYVVGAIAAVRGWRRSGAAAEQQAHFTAAVSHEMKTPIASVRAMAELLGDPRGAPDPERTRLYGERIDSEMQRLGATVRNVLDAAHIERGTLPVRPVPDDPAALLLRLAAGMRPAMDQRGFTFEVEVQPAGGPVLLDAAALEGVLLNLIDNAMKFSAERKEIALHGSPRADGGYRLLVLDRGRGLGEGNPEDLFGRYSRGAAAREGAVPGVGLGLHIARQVVEAHGGRLRARGRARGGAAFEIDLPGAPSR